MANEYATLVQYKTRLANKTVSGDDTELEEILEAASRAIDDYLEVAQGFFTPTAGSPSTKTLRGTGETFLTLPTPLSGSITITAEAGITVPDFTVDKLRLITLGTNGLPSSWIVWACNAYFAITGTWGYVTTPAQIREACLQLAIHFWRGRDKALTGTITDMRQDEQFPERDFPRMTRRLLDDFKFQLGEKPSGGLILA